MNTDDARDRMWEYLLEHHPDLRVATKGIGRSPWRYTTVAESVPERRHREDWYNHRQVLPEELVADIDCGGEELTESALNLITSLDERGLSFSVWRTNGEDDGGSHIQLLYDIPPGVETKLVKKLLLQDLLGSLDEQPIDIQVLGNHLIRFEGGAYDKLPPWKADRKTLIYTQGDPLKKNPVPQHVWDEYGEQILRWKLRGLRQGRHIPSKGRTSKSINYILSDKFKQHKDGTKRALWVLASYYHSLPEEELYTLLKDFNNYNCREPVPDHELRRLIKREKSYGGRRIGETYRKELLKDIGAYYEVYQNE